MPKKQKTLKDNSRLLPGLAEAYKENEKYRLFTTQIFNFVTMAYLSGETDNDLDECLISGNDLLKFVGLAYA